MKKREIGRILAILAFLAYLLLLSYLLFFHPNPGLTASAFCRRHWEFLKFHGI